jgi:predicted phage tail protein
VDKKNVTQDDLDFPNGNRTIRIVPIIIGSKKAAVMQTILGAVPVAASIWMPGIGIAASNMMFAAGSAMAVGGVMPMISPQVQGPSKQMPIIKPRMRLEAFSTAA